MGHYKVNRHISAWKAKLTTTMILGELCASTLEAHLGDVLEHSGIPYIHEGVRIIFPTLAKGSYSPDFIIEDPFHTGCYQCAEAKGATTEKADATVSEMSLFIDRSNKRHNDKGFNITSFVMPRMDHIDMYFNGKECYGGFYECKECGKRYFAPLAWEHNCPHCDAEYDNISLLGTKVNDMANEWNEALWKPNWEDFEARIKAEQAAFDEAKEYENRVLAFMKRVRKELGWTELRDGNDSDDPIRIQTPYAKDGMYEPDFYYEEVPIKSKSYGFAHKPLVLIAICELADKNDKLCLSHVRDLVSSRNHEFVRLVVLNSRGVHVCDWTTDGKFVDGGVYTCHDCGNHFIARRDYGCPFCGGDHCDEYHSAKKSA